MEEVKMFGQHCSSFPSPKWDLFYLKYIKTSFVDKVKDYFFFLKIFCLCIETIHTMIIPIPIYTKLDAVFVLFCVANLGMF